MYYTKKLLKVLTVVPVEHDGLADGVRHVSLGGLGNVFADLVVCPVLLLVAVFLQPSDRIDVRHPAKWSSRLIFNLVLIEHVFSKEN